MENNLNAILDNFALVTVMNVHVYKLHDIKYSTDFLSKNDFGYVTKRTNGVDCLFLDTLKLSNIKESGPQKTFKAGLKNMPVIRHGKKVELELQDALGKLDTLINFFGLKQSNIFDVLYSDKSFSEPLALEGEMKCIDLKGNITTLYLFIPCFIPSSNLSLIQDSQSNVGVFNLSGELKSMNIKICGNDNYEEISAFYLIQPIAYCGENNSVSYTPIYSGDYVTLLPATNFDDESAVALVFDPTAAVYSGDSVNLVDENLT